MEDIQGLVVIHLEVACESDASFDKKLLLEAFSRAIYFGFSLAMDLTEEIPTPKRKSRG